MGMAAVGVSLRGVSPIFVSRTRISSTRSSLIGTKLVTLACKSILGCLRQTVCQRKPAVRVTVSADGDRFRLVCSALFPVADQISVSLIRSQKLRAERLLCRSSTEVGNKRNVFWSV